MLCRFYVRAAVAERKFMTAAAGLAMGTLDTVGKAAEGMKKGLRAIGNHYFLL